MAKLSRCHVVWSDCMQDWSKKTIHQTPTHSTKCAHTFHPLTPKNDQHETSPYNILTLSSKNLMRIFELIR